MAKPKTRGEKLARAREAAGLSVRELAGLADVSSQYVYLLEKDGAVPSLATLDRMAQALGVEPGALL